MRAYSILIKDADEPEMAAMLFQSEHEMDFDEIKTIIERVVNYDDLQDKFYCRMADEETTYSIIDVMGVPLPLFTYHNVTRRDWPRAVADVITKNAIGYVVINFTPEAMAIAVKNTAGIMGLGDVTGPLRGIPHLET